ncbi:MAG: hypothetical protein HUJ22_12330 [Gracilimonas sp.]|uniref:hypothetical protein n=1 Tax=Gracilimonas sp. TaxID=1974203 RepID=UPI001997D3D0|nr:hypothetical protein [Gracilimonas sp.]MBD3617346.1 hypothetical protein [Gracilimonas sp.]
MSFKFEQLQNISEEELIKKHDDNSGTLNGQSNKETPEMVRNELFRRELRKLVEEVNDGNKTMTRLTGVITFLTFLIFALTIVLVIIEFQ